MSEVKCCTDCKRELPLSEFHIRSGTKRRNQCRLCKAKSVGAGAMIERQLAPDPDDLVRVNNAFNLWHGPVDRTALTWRIAA